MRDDLQLLGLVVVAQIAKLLFLCYRALPVALLTGWIFYLARHVLFGAQADTGWWLATLVLSLGVAYAKRPRRSKDNRFRDYHGWRGVLEQAGDELISWIGTIKYFTNPWCLVEDPSSYKISGEEVRKLIDGVLQPGDILLRGYDGYLDGLMIGATGDAQGHGQHLSHAALYVGDLRDDPDRAVVARRLQVPGAGGPWVEASSEQKEAVRSDPGYYAAGRQKVVHAMGKGVFAQDILTFLRCDYLVVLRLPSSFRLTQEEMQKDRSLITVLADDAERIRQALLRGESVDALDVLEAVHLSALGKIGSCYDFQFNNAKTHTSFSCSEFVYYCFKSVHCYLGLELKHHAFMKVLFPRDTITPSDIYDAALAHKKLEVVYLSPSMR